ncbi:MAG: PKD domain-containing protein [Gaiellaceae bacterium]
MLARKTLWTLALLALAAAVLVPAAATAGGIQLYAKGVRICKPPAKLATAHRATCDAMRRVLVRAGTAGARPLEHLVGTAATVGPNGGLTPSDLTSVYGLSGTGSGQTVAIVDAYNDPNINADLQTFDAKYGLAACSVASGCLKVVGQTGGPALPSNDTTGWSGEESLDVEAVHAVCSACKIVLVEANSPSNANLGTAENAAANTIHATEISNSFGEPETGTDASFASAFNHPGIAITASSGDDGYYDYDFLGANGVIGVPSIPAAYPTVVAVGGTSLFLSQSSTPARSYETVWNDNGPRAAYEQALGGPLGASGGGCSTLFAAQGWQAGMSGYANAACGGNRLVADISIVADPLTGFDVYDSYTGCNGCTAGWQTIGGTSLAAPLLAAVYALAGGAHSLPYPAVELYSHAAGTRYDVTIGGNGFCDGEGAPQCGDHNHATVNGNDIGVVDCDYTGAGVLSTGNGACDAAAGFDGATGVGTPKGLTLFAKPSLIVSSLSGPVTATHGTSGGPWSITATDPAPGGRVTCTWSWGDGTSNSTGCGTPLSHTYASTGTKTITVTSQDGYGLTCTPKTKKVTVG